MIAGITGHRELSNRTWVRDILISQIKQQQVTHGLSSLAAGADQLFAYILFQHHIPYTAVVPSDHFEDSFEEMDNVTMYQTLLGHAQNVHRMNFSRPSESAYWAAGQYVVDHCTLVFAVWNGKPAKGLGGTADVVQYAKQRKKRIIHLNPNTREIGTIEI